MTELIFDFEACGSEQRASVVHSEGFLSYQSLPVP